MNNRLLALLVTSTFLFACSHEKAKEESNTDSDKSSSIVAAEEIAPLWLEEVEGGQALAKVNEWNKTTLDKLMNDERFDQYRNDALGIVNATDKIPYGRYYGGYVYNYWQTAEQVRGVLRRTSLEQYESEDSAWETIFDLDKLAVSANKNWVYKGSTCYDKNYDMCMMSLSDGGKDAKELKEWNHATKRFVEGGFYIPEAKSSISWLDKDTLVVGTDWGDDTLTESGYPYITKLLKRGQTLAEATEIFRGEKTDASAGAFSLNLDGDSEILMGYRSTSIFKSQYYWLKDDEQTQLLPIPEKSNPVGIFKDQLLVNLKDDWHPSGTSVSFTNGSLVSFDMAEWMKSNTITNAKLVYQPNAKSTISRVSITKSKVLLSITENVVGNVYVFDYQDEWGSTKLDLPQNGTVSIISANDDSDITFINQESFISPDTLFKVDLNSSKITVAKSSPARFDASDLIVEQFQATSKDGVKVPYFVIRKKDIVYDGSNPTLLYGYGGFQVSLTPSYSGIRGKLWLEQGGVYVSANIRGGGEFGPKWHQAGLKTNRQVIYNDMIAVAESLIEKKITSPRRLGVMGGSNGGLLVGVMYNQRPDLWNAVVCQAPLLDMLRYHKLLAGASWVGEFGSPDIPEERMFLETISPLHNIDKEEEYPPIFFVTSTKDDRVHPAHARKMAYVLEQYGHTFEYYENIDGGHSASANLTEVAKRSALEYTFLSQQLKD
jgi:prolyl oligopeptidase